MFMLQADTVLLLLMSWLRFHFVPFVHFCLDLCDRETTV